MAYQNVKVKPRQTVAQTQQSKDLGIVSEVPMGDWNAATQYQKLNKVRYVSTGGSGVTLLAKKQNQGIEPLVTQGWQEVWMVENYDGSAVIPNGTYPEMTVGNATNAQNDGSGENIAEQFGDINEKIPSTASSDNQLADKAFVNSSINNMAAFYVTSNAQGDAFSTRADLLSATTFYSGGQARVPTQNDYAIVLADESQPVGVDGSHPTTRYSYQGGTYPNGQWDFQYVVNNTSLTQAQIDAINSGITSQLVEQIVANGEVPTKNLYNLGAFDTYASNGDGTVTITRKTGFIYFDELDLDSLLSASGSWPYLNLILSAKAPLPITLGSVITDIVSNSNYITAIESGFFPNSTTAYIEIYTNKQWESKEDAILGLSGLVIQYILAPECQYTEQVIENQPIRHLNQEGENWLDNEFRKGLNLWNNDTPKVFTASGNTSHSLTFEISNTDTPWINSYVNGVTGSITETGIVAWKFYNPQDQLLTYRIGYNGNVADDKVTGKIYLKVGEYTLSTNITTNVPNKIEVSYYMLNVGDHPYSYVPYYGGIVRQKDLERKYNLMYSGVPNANWVNIPSIGGKDILVIATFENGDGDPGSVQWYLTTKASFPGSEIYLTFYDDQENSIKTVALHTTTVYASPNIEVRIYEVIN